MHGTVAQQPVSSDLSLIGALLRGEEPEWPATNDDRDVARFLRAARWHGVMPLLDARFAARGPGATWPEALRQACHDDALAGAMYELAHRAELLRVLSALAAAGIEPLILKGTALAYSHYPSPALRPRSDTDLLVPAETAAEVARVLQDLGYIREVTANSEVFSCEANWHRTDELGKSHHLDVHWRSSTRPSLATTFTYGELAAGARHVPQLGPYARAPGPADALLFACAHRAKHVNTAYHAGDDVRVGGDRLIWLYDLHRLVLAMSPSELEAFVERATIKRFRTVCRDALERARECLATPIPAAVLIELRRPHPAEPSAGMLTERPANEFLDFFLALDGWPTRMKWLREVFFPAAEYMQRKYPDATHRWLPALYLRRALAGMRKALKRDGAGLPRS